MFLFALDAGKLAKARLMQVPTDGRPLEVFDDGRGALYWSSDEFCHVTRDGSCLCVQFARHRIDQSPICSFEWDLSSGWLAARRSWSGEFSLYFATKPTMIVASHLRILAWACGGLPPGVKRLRPGYSVSLNTHARNAFFRDSPGRSFRSRFLLNYSQSVLKVRRLVCNSVASKKEPAALLLSGGIDSASIAAAAHLAGKQIPTFVFSLKHSVRRNTEKDNDVLFARKVARHLGLPLHEILLDRRTLVSNIPQAVALAESHRGTIVDDCAALIEVAAAVAHAGFTTVWMGEAADDLFGSFKFALRYYRGSQLRKYYRHELDVSLPDELAILQRVFSNSGLSLVHPFWTAPLKELGYNLPLRYRVDSQRLMKMILRDAFASDLPEEVVRRPKGVTRDTTQIRFVLEDRFGASRERYRKIFDTIFGEALKWPVKKRNSPPRS